MKRQILLSVLGGLAICGTAMQAAGRPLKVYLLVGQSNMQGHAQVRTFDHIGMDPKTAPILKAIRNVDGTSKVCQNVWISSVDPAAPEGERHGRLTVGYGASGRDPKIGPELTFGIYMQQHVDEPILVIKTAWGGKSLNTDFRPPSAGPYEFNAQQLENLKKQGKDLVQARVDRAKMTGQYYRLMMEHINKVLGDIKRVYPAHDAKAGHELAGFVWFQGWNDMVDRGTYPNRAQPGGYAQYSEVLVHFIRDVRKDLSAPKLPFVIGVMGVGGPVEKYGPDQKRYAGIHSEFRKAMAAPAKLSEFKGNVTAVFTENYWDHQLSELSSRMGKVNAKRRSLGNDKNLSAKERSKLVETYKADLFTEKEIRILETGISNAAYHYLGSSKVLGQIGKAFADTLAQMQ
jgi:alpha-galactosidase